MTPNETDGAARPEEAVTAGQPANDSEPTTASGGDGASKDGDPIAVLEAEKADLRDKLLRSLADVENVRRRADREAADARTYAVTAFARDMLNVADNIRRALDSVLEELRAGEGAAKALIDGIELTERDLLKTLDRHGVRPIEPQGQKFDPHLHQAMFEVPNPDVPNGTVVQVLQTGYTIGDRVLRPALVGVGKGGPKAPAADGETDGSDQTNASSAQA